MHDTFELSTKGPCGMVMVVVSMPVQYSKLVVEVLAPITKTLQRTNAKRSWCTWFLGICSILRPQPVFNNTIIRVLASSFRTADVLTQSQHHTHLVGHPSGQKKEPRSTKHNAMVCCIDSLVLGNGPCFYGAADVDDKASTIMSTKNCANDDQVLHGLG
jgi:hypothetical protein